MGEGVEDHSKHPSDTLYRPMHTMEEPRALWSGEKWVRENTMSPQSGQEASMVKNLSRPARWTDAGLKNMVGLRLHSKECRREGTNNRERSRGESKCAEESAVRWSGGAEEETSAGND